MSNEELAVAYQGDVRDALPALWTQVEKLAVRMVRPYLGLDYRNGAIDWDDLMQAAFLAVERAASAFQADSGAFTTLMGYRSRRRCTRYWGCVDVSGGSTTRRYRRPHPWARMARPLWVT